MLSDGRVSKEAGPTAGRDSGTGGLEAQTESSSRQQAARARLCFHGAQAGHQSLGGRRGGAALGEDAGTWEGLRFFIF